MRSALAFLLVLMFAHPRTYAQEAPSPTPAAPGSAQPVPRVQVDGRLYWARFDAEQAARRARWNQVDLRTPRILTLSLLVPGAALLVTAAIKAMVEATTTQPTSDQPYADTPNADAERDRTVNACLAGAGGLLAVGAISSGVWWGRRRAERNRLRRQFEMVWNSPGVRDSSLGLQLRAGGVGVLVRGRF